jgi:putative ABC transport system ATP-binding protein
LRGNRKGLRIGIDRAFRDLVAQRIARLNMGLENRLDLEMGALSGGQRQALTLLMSTMDTCKVLLMDEPASALDPRSAELVMNLANEIVREKNLAALLVTHQLEDGVRYGDRILQMDQGKIIRDVSSIEKKNLDAASLRSWFNRSTD